MVIHFLKNERKSESFEKMAEPLYIKVMYQTSKQNSNAWKNNIDQQIVKSQWVWRI